MMMTNFEPTSRWAILPSGETFDFVRPGMSNVVGRERGVDVAERFLLKGGLQNGSITRVLGESFFDGTYMRGLPGTDDNGVSVRAAP